MPGCLSIFPSSHWASMSSPVFLFFFSLCFLVDLLLLTVFLSSRVLVNGSLGASQAKLT